MGERGVAVAGAGAVMVVAVACAADNEPTLAMTAFGAKSFMRYAGGIGSASVGALRPTTWYSDIGEIGICNEGRVG